MTQAIEPRLAARRIGSIAFDSDLLAAEIAAFDAFEMQTAVGYAVGSWNRCIVVRREEASDSGTITTIGAQLPHIMGRVYDTFRADLIDNAYVFAAKRGGYLRPHCDWLSRAPLYVRLHVPLQTDERCLSSEDDLVYHMRVGEIWFVDPSRPHAAGCFSAGTRLHLAVDFKPDVAVPDMFCDRTAYQPGEAPRTIDRPPFTDDDRAAIHRLGAIATEANLSHIADFLGLIHFDKHVSCAAMYDWLIEIARRAADPGLVARAQELRRRYLQPFG